MNTHTPTNNNSKKKKRSVGKQLGKIKPKKPTEPKRKASTAAYSAHSTCASVPDSDSDSDSAPVELDATASELSQGESSRVELR